MTAQNFETKLDDALDRLSETLPPVPASNEAPEIAELTSVAERLAVLKPAPTFHLAEGRRKFLVEAQRVMAQRSPRRWEWVRVARRPALLAVMATIILLTGVAFSVMMMSGLFDSPQIPPAPILATPAMSPTFTATPTRMVGLPSNPGPLPALVVDTHSVHVPQPAPIPEPARPDPRAVSISDLVLDRCLKL